MLKLVAAVLLMVYSIEWLAAPPPDAVGRATASFGLLPRQSIIAIELSTIVLMVACLERSLGNPFLRRVLVTVAGVTAVLLVWAAWSGLAPINMALGLRQYLRPLPLFLVGYLVSVKDPRREWLRSFLMIMAVVTAIQIPVSAFQYLFLTPLAAPGQTPQDVVSGTFGPIDGGTLAMFLVACAGFVLAFELARGRVTARGWILVSVLLLPPLLAGVRAIFPVLAALIIVGVVFLPTGVRLRRRLGVITGLAVIGTSGLVVYDRFVEPGFMQEFGLEYVGRHLRVTSDGERLTRGAAVVYSASVIRESPASLVLGKGIGSATRNFVGGAEAPYYHFATDRSLLSRLLIEGGGFGLLVLILLLWRVNRAGRLVWRSTDVRLVRATGLGVVLATWVAVISLPYGDVLARAQFGYPFWFLAGYVLALAHADEGSPTRFGDDQDDAGLSQPSLGAPAA
jgi:hypothetical protein